MISQYQDDWLLTDYSEILASRTFHRAQNQNTNNLHSCLIFHTLPNRVFTTAHYSKCRSYYFL